MDTGGKTISVIVIFALIAIIIMVFTTQETVLEANDQLIVYGDDVDTSKCSIQIQYILGFTRTITVSLNQFDYDKEFIGIQEANLEYKNETVTFQLTIVPRTLNAPSISLVDGQIQWSEINGVSNYIVNINNEEFESIENSYVLQNNTPDTHTLVVKVKAISSSNKFNNSEYSNTLTINKLESVTSINYENDTNRITWNEITDASKYYVWINEDRHEVADNYFEYSDFLVGENTIEVQAIGSEDIISSNVYESTISKLAPVSNIIYNFNQEKLEWIDNVSNIEYTVVIDDNEYTSNGPYLNISLDSSTIYTVGVMVVAQDSQTINSDVIYNTVSYEILSTPSATITLGQFSNTYDITVSPVANANSYEVIVTLYTGTVFESDTYTLTSSLTKEIIVDSEVTKISITVVAKDSTEVYKDSEEFIVERNI